MQNFIMATSKKRINVSLPKDVETILYELAKRDDVPPATKAVHLIKLAIEIDEDDYWDALAEKREADDSDFVSHDEAWS